MSFSFSNTAYAAHTNSILDNYLKRAFGVKVLLVLLLAAAAADGQSVHLGKCPRPSVQRDFNITEVKKSCVSVHL